MELFRRYGLEHALRDVAVPEANCLAAPAPLSLLSTVTSLPKTPTVQLAKPAALILDYASRNGSGLKPRIF